MYNHDMSVSFIRAMRASHTSIITFIGAGGKTTALFLLAKELSKNSPVVVTASSHLGEWQIAFADKHLVVESSETLNDLESKLQGITLITGTLDGDRTKPLDEDTLNKLNQFCKGRSVPLLIEADGSRQKPLKAWAEHEPPIPLFVEHVVHVVGLTGIGKPFNKKNVHRAKIFSKLGELEIATVIPPDALTQSEDHASDLQSLP